MKKKYKKLKIKVVMFCDDAIKMSGAPFYNIFDNLGNDPFNL